MARPTSTTLGGRAFRYEGVADSDREPTTLPHAQGHDARRRSPAP